MISRLYKLCFIISFLLSMITETAFNQDNYTVSGQVIGTKGLPVKEVSISVEGILSYPEVTDEEGRFTLTVTSGDVWIIIRPVRNYKGQRIFLGNQRELLIYLTENDMKSGFDDISLIHLEEKRRDIISSFTDIDLLKVNQNNFISVDQSFQGIVPGMVVVNQSGMPGQGTINYLRGISSMNTSNAPLIVLNGMPLERPGLYFSGIEGNSFNPLASIDPNDITRVTILKDPVATTVFGVRASNGVILIETLDASATQTTIDVSFKTGLSLSPANYIPQLNSTQYKLLAGEILASSPNRREFFENDYPGLYAHPDDDNYYRYMHNTNWQELVFTNSLMRNAYISLRGGSQIATYGLSVGYHDQEGIISNTDFNRYNVGFVSALNIFPWFKMKVNANLSSNSSNLRNSALSPQTSPIMTSLFKSPMMHPYKFDDQGQQLTLLDDVDELGTSNPVAIVNNFTGENKNYRFISSIKGYAEISSDFTFQTMLGINFNNAKEFIFMPNTGMERYYDGKAHSVSRATKNHFYSFYFDNNINYTKEFNKIHALSSSLGLRMNTSQLETDFGEALNLPESDHYTNLQSGQDQLKNIGGFNDKWNRLGIYQHLKYKIRDKYIFNASLTGEFSTNFGKEAKTALKIGSLPFGLFYSVGGGWRISEENFLKHLHGLNNLFLRASYGVTGNDDIGSYSAMDYYSLSLYRETSGLVPGVMANKELKHEQIRQLNLGLDISMRGDRLSLTVNYFKQITEDMLIYEPLKTYMGYASRPINAGTIENRGWEFVFYNRLIDGMKFKWDISSTLTFLSNEVIEIGVDELVTSFTGGQFVTRKGSPVNSFYGYLFEGVYSTSGQAALDGLVNERSIPFGAGDAIYRDISGPGNQPDGVINEFDRMPLGSPIPDYFGGLSNTFRYNRLSLSVLFNFVQGNKIFNYARYLNERMVDLSNQSKHVLNRWQYEGHETQVPRALWNDPIGNSDFSSRWIEDGSYIRLKALTLKYSIPDNFIFFKNADFFVTANNLFTFTNYLGFDPEFSYNFHPMRQGIDYSLMPQPREFLMGIKFGL